MDTADHLEAVFESFENFIRTCTPDQVGLLVEQINNLKGHDAAATANSTSFMSTKDGITKGKKRKKTHVALTSGVAKRPLNSFMAFRNYYSPSLAPHTQSDKSSIIKELWPADPFKAKWVMLAKAYSVLRSTRNKEEVPLDEFFAICSPLIGIIPPQQYLLTMGWQLSSPCAEAQNGIDTNLPVTRLFVPNLSMLPASYTTTTLSVDDLVQHCYDVGYVTQQGNQVVATPNKAAGDLTMAVQPGVPNDGETTLLNAELALHNTGVTYPYNELFDPASQFDVTFNPNSDVDGGRWDAFDPSVMGNGTEVAGIDWNAFLNDENLA